MGWTVIRFWGKEITKNVDECVRVIEEAILEQIGYTVYDRVLNSKDFSVPQNRERIYIVAFRNDIDSNDFDFPKGTNSNTTIYDILEEKWGNVH